MSLEQKLQDDIAKRARAYAPHPKDESWELIQERLVEPRRKRRIFIWLWLLGGVALGFGYLGVSSFNSDSTFVENSHNLDQTRVKGEESVSASNIDQLVGSILPAESNADVELSTKLINSKKSIVGSIDVALNGQLVDEVFVNEVLGTANSVSAVIEDVGQASSLNNDRRFVRGEKRNDSSLEIQAPFANAISTALISQEIDLSAETSIGGQAQEKALELQSPFALLDLLSMAPVEAEVELNLQTSSILSAVPHKKVRHVALPEISLVLNAGLGSHQVEQAAIGIEAVGFPVSALAAQSSLVNTTYGLGIEACFKNGLVVALGIDRTQLAWTAALAQPDQQTQEPVAVEDLFTGQPTRFDTMVTTTSYELRRSTKAAYFSGYAGLGYRYELGRWKLMVLGNVHRGRLAHVNGTLFADQLNDPGSLYDNLQLNSSRNWWWSVRAGTEVQLTPRIALRATLDRRQRLQQPVLDPGASAILATYGGSLGVRVLLKD